MGAALTPAPEQKTLAIVIASEFMHSAWLQRPSSEAIFELRERDCFALTGIRHRPELAMAHDQ